MNARSRFSQSAIPNGHTACGPAKKTVVREKNKNKNKKKEREKKEEEEVFLPYSAIWQSSIV